MDAAPAWSAETANHSGGGGRGQRHHENQRQVADSEKRARRVSGHHPQGERHLVRQRVERNVCGEMDRGIEEGKQSDHPSKLHERVPSREPPQRRQSHGETEKPERQNPVSRTIALNGFTFSWCIDAAHDQYRTGTRLAAKTTGFRMKRMARSDIRVCTHPSISVSGGRCNTQRNGVFYERSPTVGLYEVVQHWYAAPHGADTDD